MSSSRRSLARCWLWASVVSVAPACMPGLGGGGDDTTEDPSGGDTGDTGGAGRRATSGPGSSSGGAGAGMGGAGGAAGGGGGAGGAVSAVDGGARGDAGAAAASDARPATPDGVPGAPADPLSPILPVLMIDVGGKTIPRDGKIAGRLRVVLDHDGTLADITKRPVALDVAIGIGVRGKVSAGFPKKPYSLELRDGAGLDLKLPFLGMPKESDWVLHSCYQDITCMRNNLVYTLARETGRYAVRTRYVEVFLDGQYWGLYLVVEKIKPDSMRVAIGRPAAEPAMGDITGGYIVRNEFLGNGRPGEPIPQDWVSKQLPVIYSYGYPRPEDITGAQKTYIQGAVDKFEALMKSADWQKGYSTLIDVPSWLDFALFQELTNNVDAYMKSVYWVKLPDAMGGKFIAGPLWDFDFALGNVSFRDAQKVDNWAYKMNRFRGEMSAYNPPGLVPYVPLYWERLWMDPAFLAGLKCRWQELRRGVLDLKNINAKIDAFAKQIALAEPRDHMRWMTINKPLCCGQKIFPAFGGYVDSLRDFVARRVAFMDANLPGTCAR